MIILSGVVTKEKWFSGPPVMHPGNLSASAWQASLSDVHSAAAAGPHHHSHAPQHHMMGPAGGAGGGMIIPRAKVKRGYTNQGYNSDDGGVSDEVSLQIYLSYGTWRRVQSHPSYSHCAVSLTGGSFLLGYLSLQY